MTAIAVSPFVLTDVTLTLGIDDYQKHVSSVVFTPEAKPVTWKGLDKDSVFTATPTATWTCAITYAQDWTTADSLSQYLMDNEGDSVSATFVPDSGGASFAATLTVTPGAIGGAVDTVAESTVTLGSTKPTKTAGTGE